MEKRVIDKYPQLPISILKLKRHKKERNLRKNRKATTGDKYYTESSRKTKSYFDKDIAEFILKYYARNNKIIIDPFSGWGERHSVAKNLGYEYKGFDISQESIDYAKEYFGVQNILSDSVKLPMSNNSIDFCYTCPPYWNLEKYEHHINQLSSYKTYNEFLNNYSLIILELHRVLKENSFCVFVVGDFRKKGVFYDFTTDTINLFKEGGFDIFDKVIIDKSTNYRISMFLKQADEKGYVVKLHENILVFKRR